MNKGFFLQLEQVREKESYKKAKEILEKYDPEVINMKKVRDFP